MNGFAHDHTGEITTLSEILRLREELSPDRVFGCYAYATQSGFRTFELGVGEDFWDSTTSRWLFGIDYGRSDPRALEAIADRANAEIRIFDGQYVVDSEGFAPRRDYHAKAMILENSTQHSHGLVLGSGNFSYNGLWRSVEAGASFIALNQAQMNAHVQPVASIFEDHWNGATPLDTILPSYQSRRAELVSNKDENRPDETHAPSKGFWIEAGYVTKNRGDHRPGNQIFAPNGFRDFFGFGAAIGNSTLIGQINFLTEIGPKVVKNYRENDNTMEKLTLPMPEDHGFGVYDGKVLIFEPQGSEFLLRAVEAEEFDLVYGHRLANVQTMGGGRRFGELV